MQNVLSENYIYMHMQKHLEALFSRGMIVKRGLATDTMGQAKPGW